VYPLSVQQQQLQQMHMQQFAQQEQQPAAYPQHHPHPYLQMHAPASVPHAAAAAAYAQQQAHPYLQKHSLLLQQQTQKRRRVNSGPASSPFLATEAPPSATGWRLVKDPRDAEGERMIWASNSKNEIESLSSILVIERKETASRYLCVKCKYMFWGSKKRVKEHLVFVNQERATGSTAWVKGCTQPLTPEEEALVQRDPLETGDNARPTKVGGVSRSGEGGEKAAKVCRGSPFPTCEAAPSEVGWSSWKAPDGTFLLPLSAHV
jgi:hypothetical protein